MGGSQSRGIPGSSYHDPNATGPKAVREEQKKEIVKESLVYFENTHQFVCHKTLSGRFIRTEKDDVGRVFWFDDGALMERCKSAGLHPHRWARYLHGRGPTISQLKERGKFDQGSDDGGVSGGYANDQVTYFADSPETETEKDKEMVCKSVVYLEGVHRFVDHKTHKLRTIRTEKHGCGTVSWYYKPCMQRPIFAKLHRVKEYPEGKGPTIEMLKRDARFDHGTYNLAVKNCGNYAEEQICGWEGRSLADYLIGWQRRIRDQMRR